MIKNSIFVLMVGIFFVQPGFASFDITPVIMTIEPSGSKATVSYTATNDGDSKAPIQISVYHRVPDEDGKEKYEAAQDASDLFQIIPSQIILNPKEKRTIRVTYVGEPRIKEEMAFRIVSEEFPINVSDPSKIKNKTVASISILSKYVGSLYVKPAGTVPALAVSASIGKDAKESKMVLIIKNTGTEHKMLKEIKYKVISASDKKEYPMPDDSVKAIGNQNILAGKTRKFTIPWPKGIPLGSVKVVTEPATK